MLRLIAVILLCALPVSLAVPPEAQKAPTAPTRVAGRYSASFTQQFAADVQDTPGHSLAIGQGRGTNRNVGAGNYMDGAEIRMIQTEDLIQGTGTAEGYTMFALVGDTTRQRFTGKVNTTLAPDKSLQITFAGRWSESGGTGRYRGLTGAGTYRGHFISPSEYMVEWEGELSPAPAAPR